MRRLGGANAQVGAALLQPAQRGSLHRSHPQPQVAQGGQGQQDTFSLAAELQWVAAEVEARQLWPDSWLWPELGARR